MVKENLDELKVIRRDGSVDKIDISKISKVVSYAVEGLEGVSESEIEMQAKINFYDGIKTSDIQETIIKSAADLISVENPNYQYVAARLLNYQIRKVAYGSYTPPDFLTFVQDMVKKGHYSDDFTKNFTDSELKELGDYIDHDRDNLLTYAAMKQLEGKYLVKNRVTQRIYESPQVSFMLIGATLFQYLKEDRIEKIKRFYDALSQFKISMPTPIMAGARTRTRQFSSCVLIDVDDSLDSITEAVNAIVRYISKKAGIGVNLGRIRAVGSPVRGGEVEHTGCFSYYRLIQAAVKSCSAGGVRGGSATTFFPFWHYESPNLMVLRNNRGTEYNRLRELDYGVQFNGLFYKRYQNDENIALFSPSDVPGLYDSFFADQEEFERLYSIYENDDSIRKRIIPARDFLSEYSIERFGTGRLYFQNVDHTNVYGTFIESVAPIVQSNLCMEITLPTKPLKRTVEEGESAGEIALCTLAGFNLGAIDFDDQEEIEDLSYLIVLALDSLLDFQEYPLEMVKETAQGRRALGVGVINYAYLLAKNGISRNSKAVNNLTHKVFESLQYHLLKASNRIARERGKCALFHETKYSLGVLPIDNYKVDVDELHTEPLHCDWESLREDIKKYGLRNSTLTALMPSETSSQISNATNGIEPPRSLVSIKGSETSGYFKQLVPEVERLANEYLLAFDNKTNEESIQRVAIMQKFVDQSISLNTNVNTKHYKNGEVEVGQLNYEMMYMYKYGIKTGYYNNTLVDEQMNFTKSGEARESLITDDLMAMLDMDFSDDGCAGGGCTL